MLLRNLPAIPSVLRTAQWRADRTWVYAFLDRDDVLLYVGITTDAPARARWHRSKSPWWRFVASAYVFDQSDRGSEEEERFLVEEFRPLFNVHYVPSGTAQRAVEYCARREAWDLVDTLLDEVNWRDTVPLPATPDGPLNPAA